VFLKFIQPSIEVFHVRIDEPITTATDLLLALVCFYAYFRIGNQKHPVKIRKQFRYYFFTLGMAALFGGLFGHAFLYSLSPSWKLVSWIFMLISVAIISQILLELSKSLIKSSYLRLLALVNIVIMVFALVMTLRTVTFSAVQYYTIFGMVVIVGSLSFIIYQKTGSRGVVKFMLGVGVGIVSAVVFSYEIGLSPWFNHNDISHVILSFSALSIYKGAVSVMQAPATLL